jgi:hypothetical protein
MKIIVLVDGISVGGVLAVREEYGVFENRVLSKIFGPKRDWRKLHNEKLYDV